MSGWGLLSDQIIINVHMAESANNIERTNVLGIGVSAVNLRTSVANIESWIDSGAKTYVCVTGVHGVIESRADPALRRIHNDAGMVTPDGMPLVWLSWLYGKSNVSRVYGPDLMLEICRHGEARRWRHFLYGTTEETLEQLTVNLRRVCPELEVVGSIAPPFRNLTSDEFGSIISTINKASPDIVWVGLSTPKQERWMHTVRPHLSAAVLLGVGAAFDFHAGKVRQAPRWIQRSGLEWAYRLYSEPRRLWRRYLRNNPSFVLLVLTQLAGLRRFPAD